MNNFFCKVLKIISVRSVHVPMVLKKFFALSRRKKKLACLYENSHQDPYWNPFQNICCGIQKAACDFEKWYRRNLFKIVLIIQHRRLVTQHFTESQAVSLMPQQQTLNSAVAS